MAQITRVTSEALQATIRRLLPSQQGFGEDLEATNVITPVIDLTPTAEGSEVRQDLQRALAFGSQTSFNVSNTTTTLANSPGFWRVVGSASGGTTSGATVRGDFVLGDGASTKIVWSLDLGINSANNPSVSESFDLVFFLAAGENLSADCNSRTTMKGSYRQIATVTGELVNPSGFVIQ